MVGDDCSLSSSPSWALLTCVRQVLCKHVAEPEDIWSISAVVERKSRECSDPASEQEQAEAERAGTLSTEVGCLGNRPGGRVDTPNNCCAVLRKHYHAFSVFGRTSPPCPCSPTHCHCFLSPHEAAGLTIPRTAVPTCPETLIRPPVQRSPFPARGSRAASQQE